MVICESPGDGLDGTQWRNRVVDQHPDHRGRRHHFRGPLRRLLSARLPAEHAVADGGRAGARFLPPTGGHQRGGRGHFDKRVARHSAGPEGLPVVPLRSAAAPQLAFPDLSVLLPEHRGHPGLQQHRYVAADGTW